MEIVAYFDASGSSRDRALAIGGFVARRDQWDGFCTEWAGILDTFGVTSLHMKTLAHFNGEFKSWKGDEQRRIAFIQSLTAATRRHALQTIGVSLFVDDYRRFNTAFRLREMLGGPYALSSFFAISLVKLWADQNALGQPISVVFEHGDRGQAQLAALLRHHQIDYANLRFERKSWIENGTMKHRHPFQACDFVAYELGKAIRMLLDKEDRGVFDGEIRARKSLAQIAPREPSLFWRFLDTGLLTEIVRRFGIRPRAAVSVRVQRARR